MIPVEKISPRARLKIMILEADEQTLDNILLAVAIVCSRKDVA